MYKMNVRVKKLVNYIVSYTWYLHMCKGKIGKKVTNFVIKAN